MSHKSASADIPLTATSPYGIVASDDESHEPIKNRRFTRQWETLDKVPHINLPLVVRGALAEFIGTALLLFLGCSTGINWNNNLSPMQQSLSFGLVVNTIVQMIVHISGAHINPSVTLAVLLWGKISLVGAIVTFLCQMLGAVAGFGLLEALTPAELITDGFCTNVPDARLQDWQALCIEFALTFTLILLVAPFNDDSPLIKSEAMSVKFGLAIAGLSFAGGNSTGASMNPARTFAPALWTGVWTAHWVYWVGPLSAAIIATLLYRILFELPPPSEEKHQPA